MMRKHLLGWLLGILSFATIAAQENPFQQFTTRDGLPSTAIRNVIQDSKGFIWIATDAGVCQYDGHEFKRYTTKSGLPTNDIRRVLEHNGEICVTDGNGLVCHLKNGKFESSAHQVPTDTMDLSNVSLPDSLAEEAVSFVLHASNATIWIGTYSDGLFRTEGGKTEHLLKHKQISGIIEDHEGNFWVSTLGEGLFYITRNALTVRNFKPDQFQFNNEITDIADGENGEIFIGLGSGRLAKYNGTELSSFIETKITVEPYSKVQKILKPHARLMWVATDFNIVAIANGRVVANISPSDKVNDIILYNGTLWAAQRDGLVRYDGTELISMGVMMTSNRQTRFFNKNVNCIAERLDNSLLFGTNEGVFSWTIGADSLMKWQSNYLTAKVNDIEIDASRGIWVATDGEGVYYFNNGVKQISETEGLSSNICNRLLLDSQGAWITTNSGLSHVYKSDLRVENYSSLDGLVSEEVNVVFKRGNEVYVGTNNGLTMFNPEALAPTRIAPPVHITSLTVNQVDRGLTDKLTLSHNENNVSISLAGLSFASQGRQLFKYRLHKNDDWSTSTTNILSFPSLTPGYYDFEALVLNKDGILSEVPATLSFRIAPPFWQAGWFRAFVIIALVGASLLIFVLINRRTKRRERTRAMIKETIARYELQALRAQMNPHFVFNCLGAIQNLVLNERTREANDYLVDFSKIMRQALDYSSKSLISVQQEIDFLDLYLRMEGLRFEDTFEYTIKLAPGTDAERAKIPPLLLQPYVENAIRHGLNNLKKRKGIVLINFEVKEDVLYCSVEDNGIGREKAKALKSSGRNVQYQSKGMTMTAQRLKTLSQVQGRKYESIVEDKYEGEEAQGTIVLLQIPQLPAQPILSHENLLV